MGVSKLFAAVAASALIATPVLANPAAPLSVAQASSVKAKTSGKNSSKAVAPGLAVGIGLLAVGAVVLVVADDDDSDSD